MSLFGIRLASRALQANQRALEVNGQNITNVDTPGYTRQVAVMEPVSGPGAIGLDGAGNPLAPGGGVDVAVVQRSHAAWLDQTAARLQTQVGQAALDERTAQQVENLLGEPGDSGLQSTLERFFSAFGNLADHPDDLSARDGVLRAGNEVAGRFQQLTDGLDTIRESVLSQARDNVTAINEAAGRVAALSRSIRQAQAGGAAPNELLDQRDQLLDELSRRAGATFSGQAGGQVVVSIGGITLVQGDQAETLDLAPGSSLSVVQKSTGAAVTVPGGELHAQQEWVNNTLPGYRQRAETARDAFATAVNSFHQSGKDPTGAAGQPFFLSDAGGHLTVNPALLSDPRRVVAGDGTAGQGGVARAIAGLGAASGTVVSGYRALVAQIGAAASDGRRSSEQAKASLQQIQAMQGSESGVNLDQELADMVSLQHAYAASARLLSTYDQMLDTLIRAG